MSDVIRQTFPLGLHWPTADPFLFCAHHDDIYPNANSDLGPDASLEGRELGSDFAGKDGWRMYHGTTVPGFPQHPHRGFETVTYVRKGLVDHADSLGAAARFGRGDVQWVTAGRGISHSEMLPLLDRNGPNPFEFFQIWLNLPAADKMVDPYFTMLWASDIPKIRDGGVEVTLITGGLEGLAPPAPPPSSWAARQDSDVAIWHIHLDPQARWTLPAAKSAGTVRTLYLFEGGPLQLGSEDLAPNTGAVVDATGDVELVAGDAGADAMVLQGRPIGEPVARYGPFVMNHEHEIQETFADYRRTGFGGWPWSVDDPVHGSEEGRFAHHVDGSVERVDE